MKSYEREAAMRELFMKTGRTCVVMVLVQCACSPCLLLSWLVVMTLPWCRHEWVSVLRHSQVLFASHTRVPA